MSIKNRIDEDLKAAMRAKDEIRLLTLRQVKTAIRLKEDERRSDIDDEMIIKVLATLAKQRRESIDSFTQGGRAELADQERAELAVLEEYLPKQLSEEEVAALVDAAIAELGASSMKEMGQVMKLVLAKAAGAADGKMVSALVKDKLS